ncbi:MAG: DNA-directed RNA polymerase subunit alpha [Planctomycetota bacterium]
MRMQWRGLELPARVELDENVSSETFGRFAAEPFERGFGTTVGNSLRRILLSSLEGAAVTQMRIKGADHEFTSLPGVLEDVTDIILNIKSLIVSLEGDEPREITVSRNTAGVVTAGEFELHPDVQIVDPDHVIATLSEDVDFELTLTVSRGRGFRSANENRDSGEEVELGIIAVDSIFSPVTRVRYNTENARVGQRTDYDKLILEVWTDGTVSPEMAVVEAAKILRKHLNPFVSYFELGEEVASAEAVSGMAESATPNVDPELEQKLNMTVQELDLSVRANNCLESARISTVREMVQQNESDLLKVRSFGKTSLKEVKKKLADMGLSLGMDLNNLPKVGEAPAVMDSFVMPDDDNDSAEASAEMSEDATE